MKLCRENWTEGDYGEFCGELASLAEDGYREFAKRGTPTERPFLGVRMPMQRAMAKEILKGNYKAFLRFSPVSFEEVNVRGYVIGGLPYAEMVNYFDDFLTLIDNWATCDGFCATLKSIKKHREEFWGKIERLVVMGTEFEARVGLVLLLDYYVDFEYLFLIFELLDGIAGREEYYVRMGVAWLLCECFIHYPEETGMYLERCGLSDWTVNRAISKICDSYRVERGQKEMVRGLRRGTH